MGRSPRRRWDGSRPLRKLALNENRLSGTLPAQLGRLTKLTELLLHENHIRGALPTTV
jgi:hypothetical protein